MKIARTLVYHKVSRVRIDISDFRFLLSDFGWTKMRIFASTGTLVVGFVSHRVSCLDYPTKDLTGDESRVSNQ